MHTYLGLGLARFKAGRLDTSAAAFQQALAMAAQKGARACVCVCVCVCRSLSLSLHGDNL